MASFNTLPPEVHGEIIKNISERPFKTKLLLLNKALCYYFMKEQVRDLNLFDMKLGRLIKIITDNDAKRPCPTLKYSNLLNKIFNLSIVILRRTSEQELTSFLSCCTNVRRLELGEIVPITPFRFWNMNICNILISLPSNIIELRFTGLLIGDGDETIHSWIHYARRNTKLKKLYFKRKCTILGMKGLGEFLKQSSAITELYLERCEISDESIYTLAESLKYNATLTNISLIDIGMSAEGACALAEALKLNITLASLDLSMNNISDRGASALAEALKLNIALASLNLSINNITDVCTSALAEALKLNIALTSLNLAMNNISDKGASALAEVLKLNTTLSI